MKYILNILLVILTGILTAQTSLSGKVIEEDLSMGIAFAHVAVFKGIDFITGTETDFDGFYNFSNIDSGTYDVEVSSVGFSSVRYVRVVVYGGRANSLSFKLGTYPEPQVFEYKAPKIDQGLSMFSMGEQMIKLPLVKLSKRETKQYLRKLNRERINKMSENTPRYYAPTLMQKLPGRSINSIAQNMLDLSVKNLSLKRKEFYEITGSGCCDISTNPLPLTSFKVTN